MKKLLPYIVFFITGLTAFPQVLTLDQAVKLARLPLHCINTEYPNKTSHLINDSVDAVMTPEELHPSFYGCLDWHSSVHGHWMLTLSRAWCMKGLARALPEKQSTGKLFAKTSKMFIDQALPNVLSGNYGGEHWLASFAVYALSL